MKTHFRKLAFALALIASSCSCLARNGIAHDLPADRFICPFVDFADLDQTWSGANDEKHPLANLPQPAIKSNSNWLERNLAAPLVKLFGTDFASIYSNLHSQWYSLNENCMQLADQATLLDDSIDPCRYEAETIFLTQVAAPELGIPPAPVHFSNQSSQDWGNPFYVVFEPKSAAPITQLHVALPAPGVPPQPESSGSNPHSTHPCTPPGFYVSIAPSGETSPRRCEEEYLPYDLESRDTHWLNGIGQAWNLNSWKKSTWNTKSIADVPLSKYLPQCFSAYLSVDSIQGLDFDHRSPEMLCEEEFALAIPNETTYNAEISRDWTCPEELTYYGEFATDQDVAAIQFPELNESQLQFALARVCEWLEVAACIWQCEASDCQLMYDAGQALAAFPTSVVHSSAGSIQQLTTYFEAQETELPAGFLFPMFALYSTGDGISVIVPADLAYQWCAEANATSQDVSPLRTVASKNNVQQTLGQGTRWIVSQTRGWLDWSGNQLSYFVDLLTDLHQTQVANAQSPPVR